MALSVIDRLTPEILAVIERVLSNQPRLASVASTIGNLPPSSVKALERQRMSIPNATKASKEAAQLNRRRSVAVSHGFVFFLMYHVPWYIRDASL